VSRRAERRVYTPHAGACQTLYDINFQKARRAQKSLFFSAFPLDFPQSYVDLHVFLYSAGKNLLTED